MDQDVAAVQQQFMQQRRQFRLQQRQNEGNFRNRGQYFLMVGANENDRRVAEQEPDDMDPQFFEEFDEENMEVNEQEEVGVDNLNLGYQHDLVHAQYAEAEEGEAFVEEDGVPFVEEAEAVINADAPQNNDLVVEPLDQVWPNHP